MGNPIQQGRKENVRPQEKPPVVPDMVLAAYDLQEWTTVANEIAQIKSSLKRQALRGGGFAGFGFLVMLLGGLSESDGIMSFGALVIMIGAVLLRIAFDRYMALNEALQKYAKMKQMQDRVLSRW